LIEVQETDKEKKVQEAGDIFFFGSDERVGPTFLGKEENAKLLLILFYPKTFWSLCVNAYII
jgi:hypothetical protein